MIDPRPAAACGAALVAIGLGAVAFPRASSRGYGIAAADPSALAYVRGCGARDAVLGAIVLWHLARGDAEAARADLGIVSCVAVADALAVLSTRGATRNRLLVHLGGIPALLAAASRLREG